MPVCNGRQLPVRPWRARSLSTESFGTPRCRGGKLGCLIRLDLTGLSHRETTPASSILRSLPHAAPPAWRSADPAPRSQPQRGPPPVRPSCARSPESALPFLSFLRLLCFFLCLQPFSGTSSTSLLFAGHRLAAVRRRPVPPQRLAAAKGQ
jgi:hypothetical protein